MDTMHCAIKFKLLLSFPVCETSLLHSRFSLFVTVLSRMLLYVSKFHRQYHIYFWEKKEKRKRKKEWNSCQQHTYRTHIHTYIKTCIHTHTHTHTYTQRERHTHTHTHTQTHTHTHTNTHTHTQTHTQTHTWSRIEIYREVEGTVIPRRSITLPSSSVKPEFRFWCGFNVCKGRSNSQTKLGQDLWLIVCKSFCHKVDCSTKTVYSNQEKKGKYRVYCASLWVVFQLVWEICNDISLRMFDLPQFIVFFRTFVDEPTDALDRRVSSGV